MAHSGTIIHMRNVPVKDDYRALDAPLICKMWPGWLGSEEIPKDFEWDGSSIELDAEKKPWYIRWPVAIAVAPINFFNRAIFPRWKHPIASARHDWRCKNAKNKAHRKWSDYEFEKDVDTTSWKITSKAGLAGVRAGAMFGIGNNF
jgi:hypothetical protein